MKLTVLFAATILGFGFIACGEEKNSSDQAKQESAQTEAQNEAPKEPMKEATPAEMVNGTQVITVRVEDTEYFPDRIKFKAGVPAKIIFDQHGTTACAWDVKSPDLGIKLTEIPKDKQTEVTFTPEKEGTFTFTCGMDMLQGSIIVEAGEAGKSM